ncbi:putative helicase [Methylophilaceae bacterium 11]|nr:putative helicase [Methylophilaceae bacterium 11]
MSALNDLLNNYRSSSMSEREKGNYFEELIVQYFKNEASYQDLYSNIWTYAAWAESQGLARNDAGIDLVAQTQGTNEFHAIQCKFYAEDYRVQKSDIDSFFTASGKKIFTHRIIVSTTNNWSANAEDALQNQHPPVSKIDLNDLENSQIDWSKYQSKVTPILKSKKQLREHQQTALNAVVESFKSAERGKLIMACGTGKTFTSLKIAEAYAGKGKHVLFLVPSLSLLSQTLTEWTQESSTPLHSFAVCSDSDVGKKRKKDEETVQTFIHELRYPATTEPARLAIEMEKRHDAHHMSVVFSTYHSIDVISKAQFQNKLADFDLIICDEAHRTTGATFDDDDESKFVKVHDAAFIKAHKRLYMTATPRIYGEMAKASADKDAVTLCSMDDVALYGKELYVITFSEAVKRDLLVDYKVLVLAVDEAHVSRNLQKLLADDNNQLKVDDAAKIIGCWKALSKQDTQEDIVDDLNPMRRAVAFCQVIEPSIKATSHKVSSKNIASMFAKVVEAYQEQEETFDSNDQPISIKLKCEAEHIDGGMNASQKETKLTWLKAETPDDTCRILSNVRCLSEGVDVPALDAVLFLTPRNSQVDVVQSVGRVMRKSEGKKRGYVVLPVVIPAGMEAHEALSDNKSFKVVWQVLQALRSHDDRFDAMTNKIDINGYADISKMEVIAVTDKVNRKTNKDEKTKNKNAGKNSYSIGTPQRRPSKEDQGDLQFNIGEIERAIYAKVVQKCGNRSHWEDWANDIAKIAKTHITRISTILDTPTNTKEIEAFKAFAEELRDDLNNSITNQEIIEMLAQHLITKPVFDALFEDYSFASKNPMSLAMQDVLNVLHAHNIEKEADTLQRFYDSVKLRAQGIDNASGKQKIVVELYDKFFRNAFPKMTERLGIVYTPVEVVDFIIHSVNDVLQSEFDQTLGSDNVHIIDPFTGTGTFITRLLQSGLISKDKLNYKYKNEIHANEIVLLAYYIAAINIESVYHDIAGGDYEPFNGICLTDTFQLQEKDDLVSALLVDNSARRTKQKALDIRVIIGNPPYSVGQDSDDDNNANLIYPVLDEALKNTYVKYSTGNPRSLYNSYVKAIRWASNRIGNSGVICFVNGNGFIDKPAMDGMRKCLQEEFSNIYVLNLRGDIRKNILSKGKAKEGQNIFGSGCMSGVAIILLVKNPNNKSFGNIQYFNIGDDLKQLEKLDKLANYKSIKGITSNEWLNVTPDKHNDWINKRDQNFEKYLSLGDKKRKDIPVLFKTYSRGVATNRDAWCYSFSKNTLQKNISNTIDFYNQVVEEMPLDIKSRESHIKIDPTKISWSWVLRQKAVKLVKANFDNSRIIKGIYKPFAKQLMYYDSMMNENRYMVPSIFPTGGEQNLIICIPGVGARSGFGAIITDLVPNLHYVDTSQCFPLKIYEKNKPDSSNDLFCEISNEVGSYSVRDGITDEGLVYFQKAYSNEIIAKEDIFYYVYGLLHSDEYITRYADNLAKELPRIPCVKKSEDFWKFSKAGRALAELHINYETVAPYPIEYGGGNLAIQMLNDDDYRVKEMKFAKGQDGEKYDKTTVIYNNKITMIGIPLEAYEYVVNGKSALEWVMERQVVTTHKESGIVNNANDWAIETMSNPKYPLELFQRVITVSLESMKIVNSLPNLDI